MIRLSINPVVYLKQFPSNSPTEESIALDVTASVGNQTSINGRNGRATFFTPAARYFFFSHFWVFIKIHEHAQMWHFKEHKITGSFMRSQATGQEHAHAGLDRPIHKSNALLSPALCLSSTGVRGHSAATALLFLSPSAGGHAKKETGMRERYRLGTVFITREGSEIGMITGRRSVRGLLDERLNPQRDGTAKDSLKHSTIEFYSAGSFSRRWVCSTEAIASLIRSPARSRTTNPPRRLSAAQTGGSTDARLLYDSAERLLNAFTSIMRQGNGHKDRSDTRHTRITSEKEKTIKEKIVRTRHLASEHVEAQAFIFVPAFCNIGRTDITISIRS
ncbi:unnamed protein product [Nesidiocoris tenuis]|uniref:Uncharacterized protein n=1 Tax=Nesidiocoris tenuis TaxID=355587 RepID=A0A6H5HN82_9HEMI|nr:unnamed protein product [Nesidiocoris tenuis]